MNWSLNELDAMARKAARGAGYSWGPVSYTHLTLPTKA